MTESNRPWGASVKTMVEVAKRAAFNAGQIVVMGFLLGNVVGTILLMLPISSAVEGSTDLLTAAFTSVSALSLTGLTVVDTATHWSWFGQAVILLLIKVGGFGIMALGSLIGLMFTQKLSFKTRLTSTSEQQALGLDDFRHLLIRLFQISFWIETVLTVILTLDFWLRYKEDFGLALWHGFFHSISAFNNAGFSIYEGSLMRFVSDPIVLLSISTAAVIGGLGFPVLIELSRRLIRRLKLATFRPAELGVRLSLNARIVLLFSASLLLIGMIVTGALEWSNANTLANLSFGDKLLNSYFASVMARNNGYNALDYSGFERETLIFTEGLMFIGGGSAGTSGGLRITTFAVLIYIVIAEIRGDARVNTGTRRLSVSVQRTAVALTMLSIIWVAAMVMAMQLITDFNTDQILFEVISAFGTCGLSTGITPDLPPAGKIMLMVMMFTGRIGLVLVASSLAKRIRPMAYKLPKERPLIG
ncbi:MAG: TrkH family potassium uptake protein [Micrococcales bacterium]